MRKYINPVTALVVAIFIISILIINCEDFNKLSSNSLFAAIVTILIASIIVPWYEKNLMMKNKEKSLKVDAAEIAKKYIRIMSESYSLAGDFFVGKQNIPLRTSIECIKDLSLKVNDNIDGSVKIKAAINKIHEYAERTNSYLDRNIDAIQEQIKGRELNIHADDAILKSVFEMSVCIVYWLARLERDGYSFNGNVLDLGGSKKDIIFRGAMDYATFDIKDKDLIMRWINGDESLFALKKQIKIPLYDPSK